MEASAAAPDLRPLGIGEILDVAIKIYLRNALVLFGLVVVVVLPVQVLTALVRYSADTGWSAVAAAIAVGIFALLSGALATGACFKAVADAYLESRVDWKESLLFALRRLHSILWVTILVAVISSLGVLLLVVGAVWLYISFAVAVPVLLTEGLKGFSALGRSRQLVKGRWWATFGVIVLAAILAGVVSGVITALLAALSFSGARDTAFGAVAAVLGGTLSSVLTTPFTAAATIVLYVDLRVRREGFDLQLLAERIGLAAPPPGGYRAAPPRAVLPPAGPGEAQPPFWPPPPGWKPSPEEPPSA